MAAGALGVLALVVAVQMVEARACDPPPTTPGTTTPTPTTPSGEVFTTADGVRFTVQAVATNLQVPWSMAFAPDGRLFVTERPGRVRILDLASGRSDLALTLDDVFTESEAGLLGLALDPDFAQTRFVYIPAAQNRLALQQRQTTTGTDTAASREPARLDVIGKAVFVGTSRQPVTSLSPAERDSYRGRSGLIRVHGESISAAAMTELSRLYHELGLTSWAFHFQPEVSR